jgi:quercetin dioxygenase-like cupin family protein
MASLRDESSQPPVEIAKSPLPMKPPTTALAVLNLETEARQLRAQRAYDLHGQSAKTLVKHEHFRVVLIALKSRRRCREHRAEESVSVQAVGGGIKVHLASEEVIDLPRGCVLALEPALAHDFEAVEDSTLLVTLAWTGHHQGAGGERDPERAH